MQSTNPQDRGPNQRCCHGMDFPLQGAEGHVKHDQRERQVDTHVEPLPKRGTKDLLPEVVR
ncbi:MAG: hypothetical protein AAFX94_20490 [Myxococcota bacterium]